MDKGFVYTVKEEENVYRNGRRERRRAVSLVSVQTGKTGVAQFVLCGPKPQMQPEESDP